MLLLAIVSIILLTSVVRLVSLPFRLGRYRYRGFDGYHNPYYAYGYRRRHGIGHVILVILALLLLSHLFGGHHHHHLS